MNQEKVGIILEFTLFSRMNLMRFLAPKSTDVDVPTNDLQLVDFTHIYSSFIHGKL